MCFTEMATNTQLEAQRLVSISLTKMAQSRTQRTGASLHKSLLVATVLQKARFLCMEEVFKIVHPSESFQQRPEEQKECYSYEEDDPLIGLTPEEAGIHDGSDFTNTSSSCEADNLQFDEYSHTSIPHDSSEYCARTSVYDRENLAPCNLPADNPTYFDLDQTVHDQSENYSYNNKTLKRRRTTCESETEDTSQLVTLKKTKISTEDSLFFDDVDVDHGEIGKQIYQEDNSEQELDSESKGMDIDRITSLVSIFSFGGMSNSSDITTSATSLNSSNCCNTNNGFGSLTRSSSTPDLCSAQAKEAESIQQRPYIAMTV